MLRLNLKYNGTLYLVTRDGQVSPISYSFNEVAFASSDVRGWLLQRPDLCFVSVVVGSVLVASAGSFPFHLQSVSLAPLGC